MKKRILVVDDEVGGLGAIRQILTQKGYEVTAASSGEEALRWLGSETTYDLVVLDVIMPGISGFDVCRRIREDPRSKRVPVIFLTGKGDSIDIVAAQEAGSDLYLVKPVLATKLLNLVGLFLSDNPALAHTRDE
jgi:DNA-binding response OmpR family regulator